MKKFLTNLFAFYMLFLRKHVIISRNLVTLLLLLVPLALITNCDTTSELDESLNIQSDLTSSNSYLNNPELLLWLDLQQNEEVLFESDIVLRESGKPITIEYTVDPEIYQYFDGTFKMIVKNGDEDLTTRVTSAHIWIDGEEIISPDDFNNQVDRIEKSVVITETSKLNATVEGKPGTFIQIWIVGNLKEGHAFIGAEGGIVTYQDITLEIPPNAWTERGIVILGITGEEPQSVPNQNFEMIDEPFTIQLPVTAIAKPLVLKTIIPDVFDENTFNPILYNGNSYYPYEFFITENQIQIIIDVINWEGENIQGRIMKNEERKMIVNLVNNMYSLPSEYIGLKQATIVNGNLELADPDLYPNDDVLILIHGIGGDPTTWTSMIKLLNEDLPEVKILTYGYKSYKKITKLGEEFNDELSKLTNGIEIDIISHSMGGLVSRSMLEHENASANINYLITLGTPHLGSPLTVFRKRIGYVVALTGVTLKITYNLMTKSVRDMKENSGFIDLMKQLEEPPDPYSYFSIACINDGIGYDNLSITTLPGLDDGVVTVESALGVKGDTSPPENETVEINDDPWAHMAMVSNEDIYSQVLGFLKRPVAYYSFNGQTNDISGNDSHGTFNGGTPDYVADLDGNSNYALNFDGVDDYVQVPNNEYTTFGTGDFTVSLLFKSTDTDEGIIFSTRNTSSCSSASGANTSLSYERDGKLLFLFRDNSSEYYIRTDESFDCNWHMVVISREGTNVTLYVDGVAVKSTTTSSVIDLSTTGDMFIGKTMYCSGNHYEGAVDEFKIFNKALNSSEVEELYNDFDWTGNQGDCSEPYYAYYPFDGNTNDYSGNNRHATPHGVIPTTDRFGNPNSAYDFDGSTDWIEAGFNIKEPTGSVSVWFRTEEFDHFWVFGQIHHPIAPSTLHFSNHPIDYDLGFLDIRNSDNLQAGVWMSEIITLNEWHHLVCIWGEEGGRLYYDGVLQGSTNLTYYDNASVVNMGIGCYNGNFPRAHYINGQIDDFKVYDYAITDAQVADLFSEGGWTGN